MVSSAAVFASETIATCFAIYLGESIIANEVLSATKGRAMGWGWVALGFGFAFGFGKEHYFLRFAFVLPSSSNDFFSPSSIILLKFSYSFIIHQLSVSFSNRRCHPRLHLRSHEPCSLLSPPHPG